MNAWFAANDFKGVAIEIKCVESFTWLNASYVPVLKQLQDAETKSYYFRSGSGNQDSQKTALKFRNPKYLSMLNHLRFYIPEVYPALRKVLSHFRSHHPFCRCSCCTLRRTSPTLVFISMFMCNTSPFLPLRHSVAQHFRLMFLSKHFILMFILNTSATCAD